MTTPYSELLSPLQQAQKDVLRCAVEFVEADAEVEYLDATYGRYADAKDALEAAVKRWKEASA